MVVAAARRYPGLPRGRRLLILPDLTLIELIHIIGLWALVVSGLELATAAKLRHHITDERFLALAASGSFVFGSYLTFRGPST